MLTATKAKNERQWKKSEQNKYDISSIKRVARKFLEVSRCISLSSRAKQRQRNVKKKSVARAKLFFFLHIRLIVVFSPFSFPWPLSITRFYILFEQTIHIIESFAFSPG